MWSLHKALISTSQRTADNSLYNTDILLHSLPRTWVTLIFTNASSPRINNDKPTFFFGATAPSGPWSPHSRGFYDAPQSVRLLWTSDQFVSQTSTWKHTTLTTDTHAPGGIWTHNLSKWVAADLRLRLRGRDRQSNCFLADKSVWLC
jgi:hypothetical protein